MAEFVEGNNLNSALEHLIKSAEEYLILISPFIKLHERIKDQLMLKRQNQGLEITILFGKAEWGTNRLTPEDIEFFKSFPNIEIRYKENLHAKYYASDEGALITSLNLYEFSQNKNIEAGVYMETPRNMLSRLTGMSKDATLDGDAFNHFMDVIETSVTLYRKIPGIETSMLGMRTTYTESIVEVDQLEQFFNSKELKKYAYTSSRRNYGGVKEETKVKASDLPQGFCIRTGKAIPFDLKMPYSSDAFSSWSRFKNDEYPEKYCHFSGDPTKGETCFKKPVLNKYWKQSKQRS